MDFGSILGPFWSNFGSKDPSKIKVHFCMKKGMDIMALGGRLFGSPESRGGGQGGPKDHRTWIYKDI